MLFLGLSQKFMVLAFRLNSLFKSKCITLSDCSLEWFLLQLFLLILTLIILVLAKCVSQLVVIVLESQVVILFF